MVPVGIGIVQYRNGLVFAVQQRIRSGIRHAGSDNIVAIHPCTECLSLQLIGQAEGYTTVTFAYARSWEEGVTPVYELVYDISVDSDLNVTIVSTTFIVGEE